MLKPKTKIKLSDNLKMGVAGPTSQSTFFKYGGVIFLLLSLYLAHNIYKELKDNGVGSVQVATSANLKQQVLGAYDQSSAAAATTTASNIITPGTAQTSSNINFSTYKVQKGDTIFGIAQTEHVGWAIIATLNKLKSPYTLHIGQILKLPPSPQNQN
jgi:LysM repeat protein